MINQIISWLERQRRTAVLRHVQGRYLDVGCGQNNAVKDYRKRGGEGTGIDVYDFGGADRIVQDTSKLDYPDGAFDTISFIACLNHIPNRADALKEAFRLLSPGGRVVITMIPPRLSAVWHLLIRPWDEDQTDRGMKEGEVCGLTPDEICGLLERSGFVVETHSRFVFGLNNLFVATQKPNQGAATASGALPVAH